MYFNNHALEQHYVFFLKYKNNSFYNLTINMDIIMIFNGLGNQMSQYALYYSKKTKYPKITFFVTNKYQKKYAHNGYELDKVFGIKTNKIKDSIFNYIRNSLYKPIYGYRVLNKITKAIEENPNYDFNEKILHSSPIGGFTFYWGGWHSEKYFRKYRSELLKIFRFNENQLNIDSKKYLETINQDEYSCSLHIRRGDYLNDKKWSNAVPENYYPCAVDYVKKIFPSVTFYVFSNDIDWCRKKLGNENFVYIDCNHGIDSWQDMCLMSKCHHHINANSTFSWWGAWLCQYPDSITVVPKSFCWGVDVKDVYPDTWVKI